MSDVSVRKIHSYDRVVECMSDKSISIRAVLFNAFAVGGRVRIDNLLLSDDVLSAVDCAKRLGARIELDGNSAYIEGAPFASCELDCGNSGTTARLLTGLLAGLNGTFTITGDKSLSSRPMKRVTDPLKMMGADIVDTDGHLPLTVHGAPLHGIEYKMPVASAQVKSAIMLAAINAVGTTTIIEPTKSRDHSENMLCAMNGNVKVDGDRIEIGRSIIHSQYFTVPGDISSAAFPICLALASGGKCVVKNVGINKTRTGILDVLENMGANIKYSNVVNTAEPSADITVVGDGKLKPFVIDGDIVPRLVDEIPVLCALACFVDGVSVVKGAGELKVKETDRIATVTAALSALGADIVPTDDGMIIHGGKKLKFGVVDPKLDHRIAMAAAVAGAAGEGVKILDGDCVSVSYPNFYKEVIGD
ncbi:MAG: 3-phosphoshikimate 1-carboxyvinyltransferase [Clostridiales bacterium]|nr:3-phosphoshikimate 1-carboxyvinyltransferase [Clostridiales bacterium]